MPDVSTVTIPEGKNSCSYSLKALTYPGYPCRVSFWDNMTCYWSKLLDDASGDVTGVDVNIEYALSTTEKRNISGTIYLPEGVVAPKEGISLSWNSKSGFYGNDGFMTIPEGESSIAYDATFLTDTSEQTELSFSTDNGDMQYSFIVEKTYTQKDVTLTKVIAPQLTGFSWEKGSSYGTTKATTLPDGTLKYVVGAANMLSQPKVGKTETAYTKILVSNEDIPVTAGQHIFIVSVNNNGKTTGWADVTVDTENIKAGSAMGDVNDDGAVNAFDFALMKLYLLGKTTNINKMNSDMNMDGEIDALDFALLKKQLLK
jgi:hypothetical protein